MKIFISKILLIASLAATAFGDQAAVIPKKPADRAAALLRAAGSVLHYCARCEGDKPKREDVKKVVVLPWDNARKPNQFVVQVNGKDIDLAYVYIERTGAWTNLARLVNVEIIGVPTVLDVGAPEKTEIFELF